LASGNPAIAIFIWDTSGFAKGNYVINAYVTPVPNKVNTANNNSTDVRVYIGIPSDIKGDGAHRGSLIGQPGYDPNADFNDDDAIDSTDLGIMGVHWGEME
jgi:hypothetical protein